MKVREIHVGGVKVFTPTVFKDRRGVFLEAFRWNEISKEIGVNRFVQMNVSASQAWVLRGLHYQLRDNKMTPGQGKLIRCLAGKIMQVSVDVRKGSKSFGTYATTPLDDVTHESVWVPPGFANGFFSFERGAVVQYEMTGYHVEELARELWWCDPTVGIKWPLGAGAQVHLSEKDKKAPRLDEITPWE